MKGKNKIQIQFVLGNYEDKYNTKNPISKFLVKGFIKKYRKGLAYVKANIKLKKVVDLGCGEGFLLREGIKVLGSNVKIFACDISKKEIFKAKQNLSEFNVKFSIQNVEDLKEYEDDWFDLVTCCEVLEHVFNPQKAMKEIYRILKKGGFALLSVPNEPIWRILNVLRGKYLRDLGNTPGHVNHWTPKEFKAFVEQHGFNIELDISPFPWTMLIIRKV